MWSRLLKYQTSQWFYQFPLKTFPVFSSFYAGRNISEHSNCPESSSSKGQTFVTFEVNNNKRSDWETMGPCIRVLFDPRNASDKINALCGSAPRWRQTPAGRWALPNHKNYCSELRCNMIKTSKLNSGEPKQMQPIKALNEYNQKTNIVSQPP